MTLGSSLRDSFARQRYSTMPLFRLYGTRILRGYPDNILDTVIQEREWATYTVIILKDCGAIPMIEGLEVFPISMAQTRFLDQLPNARHLVIDISDLRGQEREDFQIYRTLRNWDDSRQRHNVYPYRTEIIF
jgi:hypothetical protein